MTDTNTMTRDELEEELIALAACIPNIRANDASLSEAQMRAARILAIPYAEIRGGSKGD